MTPSQLVERIKSAEQTIATADAVFRRIVRALHVSVSTDFSGVSHDIHDRHLARPVIMAMMRNRKQAASFLEHLGINTEEPSLECDGGLSGIAWQEMITRAYYEVEQEPA